MKKLNLDQFLFALNLGALSVLFVGYILTTGLGVLNPDTSKNYFRFITGGLSVLAIVFGGRLTLGFLGTTLVFVITLLASGNNLNVNLIFMAISVQALTALTARRASVVLFLASCAGVGVHLLARAAGMAASVSTTIDGRIRSAGGFSNANQTAIIYLTLIAAAMLMHMRIGTKRTLIALILSLLVSATTMLSSDSRTSLLSVLIMFALYGFIKYGSKIRVMHPILRFGISLAPVFAVWFTIWLEQSKSINVDVLFSYRPVLFWDFAHGLSASQYLWGWQISNQVVDNSYLTLLSAVGAVVMAAIVISVVVQMYRLALVESPIAVVAVVAGITESFMMRPEILLSEVFLAVLLVSHFRPDTVAGGQPASMWRGGMEYQPPNGRRGANGAF